MIRAGAGQSRSRSSREAGRQIAESARLGLEGTKPRLLLLHATDGYDHEQLVASVREVFAEAPLAGCSAEGVIGLEGSDEGSHAATLLALGGACFAATHLEEGLGADPRGCGERLARWVEQAPVDAPRLLLLYPDGLTGDCGAMLEALGRDLSPEITVVGGTAADAMRLERTFQFRDGAIRSDSVAAALVGGAFTPRVVVSHGCSPVGPLLSVTAADGAMLQGLDERPPWEVFRHYLEGEPLKAPIQDVVHLCLLMNPPGDPQGQAAAEGAGRTDAVARSPVAIDTKTGAMRFPGGLHPGMEVRMGIRDPERVANRAVEVARTLFEATDLSPLCVLHFDCAGRGRSLFGPAASEKATLPLLATRPPGVPWSGFHTYGEIGSAKGRPRFHNYTLVLCALFPEEQQL